MCRMYSTSVFHSNSRLHRGHGPRSTCFTMPVCGTHIARVPVQGDSSNDSAGSQTGVSKATRRRQTGERRGCQPDWDSLGKASGMASLAFAGCPLNQRARHLGWATIEQPWQPIRSSPSTSRQMLQVPSFRCGFGERSCVAAAAAAAAALGSARARVDDNWRALARAWSGGPASSYQARSSGRHPMS